MRRAVLLSLFLAAGCSNKIELPVLSQLPQEPLEKFGLADYKGKVWLAGFIFTRCAGPCPMITFNMAALQKSLPPEVRLASFSVDPAHDTPAVLEEYAARFGADPARWRFVTGKRKELYRFYLEGFRLGVSLDPKAPPSLRAAHSAKLVLVDGKGRIRAYYDGTDANALKGLPRDAAALLKEPG